MARRCAVCGKGPRFNPNLQRVRAMIGGSPQRVRVCTACLKAGKVKRVA
jgi:large subunit ribosomal protein L28